MRTRAIPYMLTLPNVVDELRLGSCDSGGLWCIPCMNLEDQLTVFSLVNFLPIKERMFVASKVVDKANG